MEHPKSTGTNKSAEWVRREDSAQIYSNMFFLNWSIVDVRIRFGEMIPIGTSPEGSKVEYVVEENAAVTMSWAQVKALRDSLNDAVTRYENTNGEIDLRKLKLPQ
jgi:hypothetical protein